MNGIIQMVTYDLPSLFFFKSYTLQVVSCNKDSKSTATLEASVAPRGISAHYIPQYGRI